MTGGIPYSLTVPITAQDSVSKEQVDEEQADEEHGVLRKITI